jgi:hypothetical protein
VPPLRVACPSPPSGWAEDLHLPVTKHARHTRKGHTGTRSRVACIFRTPRGGSAAASSPSRVVNSCLPVIYTLEMKAMQEIPAWPRYTGVLFFGARPRGRRTRGHHPPPLPVPGLRAGENRQGIRLTGGSGAAICRRLHLLVRPISRQRPSPL